MLEYLAYMTYEQFNKTGMDNTLVYANIVVPTFSWLLLFAIYLAMGLAIYGGTRRYLGEGDAPAAFTLSGLITTFVCLVMTLKPGIVTPLHIITFVSLTIIGLIILSFTRGRRG